MSTERTSQVAMVAVKRYDVNLTLDDILTPLTQSAGKVPEAGPGTTGSVAQSGSGAAGNPDLAQHMQTLSALAGQLKEVISKINQIDPTLLAPTPRRPPKA